LLERLSKGYKASNSYINKTSGSVALFHFCQRQILSCANLGPINIDLVGMELILTLIKRVFWYSDGFYRKQKRTLRIFEPSVSISIFDLSDAILERC
jgi:hypothetical protein